MEHGSSKAARLESRWVVARILVGVGHPADVHFFKNFIAEMQRRGHEVFVAAREKEIACYLLDTYGIPYWRISAHRKGIVGKSVDFFRRWRRTYLLCQRLKPDIAIGVGDFFLPQAGTALGFPAIVITDTEAAVFDSLITFPFAEWVLTPSCYHRTLRKKTVRYNSYNALAYLNQRYFAPEPGIYGKLGIEKGQPFVIVRFVGRTAVHDFGGRSMEDGMKSRAVKEFSRYARVFVSSELGLPRELAKYRIPCAEEDIHHAVHYADLLYGDSATMASEAACLGTPAIYVDDRGRGYTDELEKKYGLVFNFGCSRKEQERSVRKGVEILEATKTKKQWQEKRRKMLGDKIDLTEFLVKFVAERLGAR